MEGGSEARAIHLFSVLEIRAFPAAQCSMAVERRTPWIFAFHRLVSLFYLFQTSTVAQENLRCMSVNVSD